MTKTARRFNVIGVIAPFVGVLAAIILFWNEWVDWFDLALFAVLYVATGLGITVGYHRLLTHRSFRTYKPLEYGWAMLGSLAVEGSPIDWVADHRKHHAHPDKEGDPHSPHVGHGSGLAGLWHAHMGWMFVNHGLASRRKYAAELVEDPIMRKISKKFPWFVVATLVIPTVIGFAWHGGIEGALRGYIWGGLVRLFFVHHVTWSINSICHFYGKRRFEIEDLSTNVAWLAIPSLGEAWHHNHHAFPRSATHGLKRWEIDVSGMVITAMEKLGLAWNVVRITPERQEQRLVGAVAAAGAGADADGAAEQPDRELTPV